MVKEVGGLRQGYWDHCKKILSCKVLMFFVVFTTALCFGFTITNFSVGIDDPAAHHYLHTDGYGSMIQQGRLFHVVYNLLTNALEFLPFFNDFLGASLLALSSLLFCALFSYVTQGKLSTVCMTVFCCVFISNPIIHEKYIYNLDVIATTAAYCAVALSLMYTYNLSAAKTNGIKAILLLMVALSSYETFGPMYFCGVFALFILRIVVNKEPVDRKILFKDGLKFAAVLLCAYILYYSLVVSVQLFTGQFGIFHRGNAWAGQNPLTAFLKITRKLIRTFLLRPYLPLTLFTVFAVLGGILFLVLSVKKRSPVLFVCFCGLFAGNLFIHYVCGYVMYRAAQTFSLFIAFVALILVYVLCHSVYGKRIVIAGSVLLVLVQAAELNRWFYNDYIRYQKESYMVHSIATEMAEQCDVSKPVIFTARYSTDYLSSEYYTGGQYNGKSAILWCCRAFDDPTTFHMRELFRMYGYDFLVAPTEKLADKVLAEVEKLEEWPGDGYFWETEEYILVKIP